MIAHQTFGDMLRWKPHFHAIVLESGFDDEGIFCHLPFSGLDSMIEVFCRGVIGMLMNRGLLKEDLAENLLSWRHSGFSIVNSVRIFDDQTRGNLAAYTAQRGAAYPTVRRMRTRCFHHESKDVGRK